MIFFQKQKKILAGLFLALGLVCFLIPQTSQARGLVPCGGYQENGEPEAPCKFTDIFALIARVTNWLIGMAGIYAIYVLISAGFWMIASQGNEEALSSRKKQATNAVVGFVFTMMAYMFVNTAVNYILVGQKPGFKLDLGNPTCYLAPTTQNQCFVEKGQN